MLDKTGFGDVTRILCMRHKSSRRFHFLFLTKLAEKKVNNFRVGGEEC